MFWEPNELKEPWEVDPILSRWVSEPWLLRDPELLSKPELKELKDPWEAPEFNPCEPSDPRPFWKLVVV